MITNTTNSISVQYCSILFHQYEFIGFHFCSKAPFFCCFSIYINEFHAFYVARAGSKNFTSLMAFPFFQGSPQRNPCFPLYMTNIN